MATSEFLAPRLTGARFEGHSIPFEVLRDLVALDDMVREVAKHKFLQDNPGRKRVPKGFSTGVRLRLGQISEGSAVPQILIEMDETVDADHLQYFNRAKEDIVEAIGVAQGDGNLQGILPAKALSCFDRLGRSLEDGEAIEFTTTAITTPVKLNKEVRRKLILASPTMTGVSESVTLRGLIPEADQERNTFKIRLVDGRQIIAPITEQHRDAILEIFNKYNSGARVELSGVGRYDRTNRLVRLDSLAEITPLDPLDVGARLDELGLLQNNWIEGAKAPSRTGLNWFQHEFDQRFDGGLPSPHIYPTVSGGIQLEWSDDDSEVTVEVNVATKKALWHLVSLDDEEDEERTLDLGLPGDWSWLNNRLREVYL
jgi:hypothetical protein